MPHVIVVNAVLVFKRVAFDVVWLLSGIAGVGFKTAVLGCREKLVGIAAGSGIVLGSVLVHVKNECLDTQARPLFGWLGCPARAANVVRSGPVSRTHDLASVGSGRNTAIGGIRIGNRLGVALTVGVGSARIFFKILYDTPPVIYIRNIVGVTCCRQAIAVVCIYVTHHHNIAFDARVIAGACAATTIRIVPCGVVRKAIGHRGINGATDGIGTG